MASTRNRAYAPFPGAQAALAAQPGGIAEQMLGAAAQYHRAGQFQEAARLCQQVLATDRNNPNAHYLLGIVESDLGDYESAIRRMSRFIRTNPKSAEVHANLGVTLTRQGKHMAKAIATCRKAVLLQPDDAVHHFNLGNAFRQFGRTDEAMASYRRSIELRPDFIKPINNLGMLQLMSGQFEEGWRNYLIRPFMLRKAADYWRAPLPAEVAGKRILVDQEQGLGDEIFFLRFISALKERGARVSYLPAPRLAAMLERAGIVPIIDLHAAGADFDFRLSAGDLPYVLGMKDGNPLPPSVTLVPLHDRVDALSRTLARFGPPPYIGVTWRAGRDAGPAADMNKLKEVPLPALAKAIADADARIVALQRNPEEGEVAAFEAALGRPALDLTGCNDDLEDMLALMGLLDDYVCVSNTNVHLRAARGRPSKVLVPNPPWIFTWMTEGAESPWFPASRVYRQTPRGDWSPAFAALARDLAAPPPSDTVAR